VNLARHAPSSMDGQPCHFVVVRDPAARRALAAIKNRHCPPEKRAFPSDFLADVPVVIVVCVDRGRSNDRDVENAAVATAFLLLAAQSRGLGSVYMTARRDGDPELAAEVRALLAYLRTSIRSRSFRSAILARHHPRRGSARWRRSSTMSSSTRFELAVDRRHDAARSVVLRYLRALDFSDANGRETDFRDLLAACSIAEGMRCFHLLTYEGVELHVLDETSAMHTGTLKSIDGCVTMAVCRMHGHRRVVFETGGNTGRRWPRTAGRRAFETFCVVPEENLALLDGPALQRRRRAPDRGAGSRARPARRRVPGDTLRARRACTARELAIMASRYPWLLRPGAASRRPPAFQPSRPDDQRRVRTHRHLRRARRARRAAADVSSACSRPRNCTIVPRLEGAPRPTSPDAGALDREAAHDR
jgi:hypothetical protein